MMFEVEWTGYYPCLCDGEWKIYKNGTDVSYAVPKELRHAKMNTYGRYRRWDFDENYMTVFTEYTDGLHFDEWLSRTDGLIQSAVISRKNAGCFTQ